MLWICFCKTTLTSESNKNRLLQPDSQAQSEKKRKTPMSNSSAKVSRTTIISDDHQETAPNRTDEAAEYLRDSEIYKMLTTCNDNETSLERKKAIFHQIYNKITIYQSNPVCEYFPETAMKIFEKFVKDHPDNRVCLKRAIHYLEKKISLLEINESILLEIIKQSNQHTL